LKDFKDIDYPRMKVLLLVVALAAVAVSHPLGRRRGPKGPPPRPCRILYSNGTLVTNDCFTAGGRFSCEAQDLSKFEGRRRPPFLEGAVELSVCKPKSCETDDDCSQIPGSVCREVARLDDETEQVLKNYIQTCAPSWPPKPERPDRPEKPDRSEESQEDRPPKPKMCTIPVEARVASMACQVTYDGATTTPGCGPSRDGANTCQTGTTCTVTIDGKDAVLSFCAQPPPRPPPKRRHGPRGPPMRPCRVEFSNGTVRTSDCFTAGGRFSCEVQDLTKFEGKRRPPFLEDVVALSVCKPKTCETDDDCEAEGSVCQEVEKPDDATKQAIKNYMQTCAPSWPPKPERPDRPEKPDRSEESQEDRHPRPKMCTVPVEARVVSRRSASN